MLVRSLLFAPANRPDLFGKFPRLEADLFALDLEDGTPADARAAARAGLADAVRAARGTRSGTLFVRINPAGSSDFAPDLAAAQGTGVDGLILAKTESAAAGIESIAGVMNAAAIAAGPSVFAVYFGAEDFAADMGARRTPEGLEVLYARSRVVLAAKAARVRALDQVVLDLKDETLFRRDATLGRNLGYDGKLCIHPRQIALANEVYAPTPGEIDHARRLVAAYDAARARGEATLDFEGRMVDGPVYKTALATLAAAEPAG